MSKFIPLFSGSSGNCVYIEHDGEGILIDAGVSNARIVRALGERDIPTERLRAVFITHSHGDHINGMRVLASRLQLPVYCTSGTLEGIADTAGDLSKISFITGRDTVELDTMRVRRFPTPHDCEGSCGYTIELGERRVSVCTDLGCVTEQVHAALEGSSLVMLESNHDIGLLQQNPKYVYSLKQRIMGRQGHLSNGSCADEIARLVESGTTRFILAHLSRENNRPELAYNTTDLQLRSLGMNAGSDYLLSVAAPSDNKTVLL